MTGSRLGWIIGPEDVIEHAKPGHDTTYGVPGYIQDAGEFALAQGGVLENEIAALSVGGGKSFWTRLVGNRSSNPYQRRARCM